MKVFNYWKHLEFCLYSILNISNISQVLEILTFEITGISKSMKMTGTSKLSTVSHPKNFSEATYLKQFAIFKKTNYMIILLRFEQIQYFN